MRIARLQIENFRNFHKLDLQLSPATVIVGENRTGKSNLIHAMRLVLDPSLSQNDRQLGRDDFWDGLSDGTDDWDPMQSGHIIEVSVELVDFEEELAVVAALGDALTADNPLRARITYRYAPVSSSLDSASRVPKYRSTIYGGGDLENQVPNDLRGYLHFTFLHALRNVEDDIRNWRRSPLRRMLETVAKNATEEELKIAKEAVSAANKSLR
ncbi:AAA family ATPase, partial [Pseudonocardia zijingensis]